jgi:radical SAM superfamily enzyme YgiQ (UPF0313 family)
MSFWPPLAFASLAGALREALPDLRVAILDAAVLQMGWRTLEREIRRLQPAYVGLGEEAVSCVEGLRLARLAKAGGARVIAGGCFFGHVAPQVLATGLVDIVVHGEGEITIVELVEALRSGAADDLRQVRGISYDAAGLRPLARFRPPASSPIADSHSSSASVGIAGAPRGAESDVVFTGHRSLIDDLDRLPFPAYDLLPVERYGERSRNHPRFAAIELSRGCLDACSFCVLWRQMGHFQGSRVMPRLRAKSPERLIEEVRRLARRFHRGYLGWVDPCFNADPQVPAQLAERMLRENLRLGQSAWVRADGLLRDEASGALETCVAAGLNEVYAGIERPDTAGLEALHKREDLDQCRRAFRLLAQKYPQIFIVGSFIYGLPGDTPDTVRRVYRLSLELDLDKAFFIPLTPLPGTPFWRPELWDATGRHFRAFSFLPHPTATSPFPELDGALLACMVRGWRLSRVWGYWRGLFHSTPRKRRLTWRVFLRSTRFVLRLIRESFLGGRSTHGMLTPKWYE